MDKGKAIVSEESPFVAQKVRQNEKTIGATTIYTLLSAIGEKTIGAQALAVDSQSFHKKKKKEN